MSYYPVLLTLQKIWDQAPHNAMTDLIWFKENWYCAFRESDSHVYGKAGEIRILKSEDGVTWFSCALLKEKGIDLRDPKFSITPDGQLMLLFGGTLYAQNKTYESLQSRVSFSSDGKSWSQFQLVLNPHQWLWRVTWFQGKAYGAAYSRSDPKDKYKEWLLSLYWSDDGLNFQELIQWEIPGYPNETTLRFLKTGQMVALVRRDGKKDTAAWIGVSDFPFLKWNWSITHQYFGGPNFLVLENGDLWATGRILLKTPYGHQERTVVAHMDLQDIHPVYVLPSGGDCSYPGMVFRERVLWVSYYSSHEGQAAIYLARVDLGELGTHLTQNA